MADASHPEGGFEPDDITPNDIALFEFDPAQVAVINPSYHYVDGMPERAVACWFGNVVRERTLHHTPIAHVPFEHGNHDIHVIHHKGEKVALFSPGVGAPAAVTSLEIVMALGATKVIGCGGAGILVPGFDVGHVIIPVGAVRDEGTSFHYAPAGEAVHPHPDAVAAIDATLAEHGVPHDRGLTWTTDAFFRETPAKVARRREQGCLTVDMEASAMFACAAFRGATYGQLLYAGDDVSATEWDNREWDKQASARDRLLDLALDAVLRL